MKQWTLYAHYKNSRTHTTKPWWLKRNAIKKVMRLLDKESDQLLFGALLIQSLSPPRCGIVLGRAVGARRVQRSSNFIITIEHTEGIIDRSNRCYQNGSANRKIHLIFGVLKLKAIFDVSPVKPVPFYHSHRLQAITSIASFHTEKSTELLFVE